MPNDSAPSRSEAPSEELDLAIPDMVSQTAQNEVKTALTKLQGIMAVRLLERGAFVKYNPLGINKDEICTAIRQAGFRASTFQDSRTGETGRSSQ